MNRRPIAVLFTAVLAMTLCAQSLPDLEKARETHTKNVAISAAQHKDRIFALKKNFTVELDRFENLAKAKGDLDSVLISRRERDRMDRPLTAAEMKSLPESLRGSRARFEQSVAKSAAQERAEVSAQDRAYLAQLQALQTRLTRAGDIDSAVKVKNTLEAVLAARKDSPAPGVAPSSGPSAVASEMAETSRANLREFVGGEWEQHKGGKVSNHHVVLPDGRIELWKAEGKEDINPTTGKNWFVNRQWKLQGHKLEVYGSKGDLLEEWTLARNGDVHMIKFPERKEEILPRAKKMWHPEHLRKRRGE